MLVLIIATINLNLVHQMIPNAPPRVREYSLMKILKPQRSAATKISPSGRSLNLVNPNGILLGVKVDPDGTSSA